jgi:hypothetical protein
MNLLRLNETIVPTIMHPSNSRRHHLYKTILQTERDQKANAARIDDTIMRARQDHRYL